MAFIVYSNRDVWMTENYANECFEEFVARCGNCTMQEGSVELNRLRILRMNYLVYYTKDVWLMTEKMSDILNFIIKNGIHNYRFEVYTSHLAALTALTRLYEECTSYKKTIP